MAPTASSDAAHDPGYFLREGATLAALADAVDRRMRTEGFCLLSRSGTADPGAGYLSAWHLRLAAAELAAAGRRRSTADLLALLRERLEAAG